MTHPQDGDDICIKDILYFIEINVEPWDSAIAACIVNKLVERASSPLKDVLLDVSNGLWRSQLEWQSFNAYAL